MKLVATRVLIINKQLGFNVRIKQSLEQVGRYEVTPFTSADTALDHLRTRPYDAVLIDFTLTNTPGHEIVAEIRNIQPDIAIIASPDTPDVARQINLLRLNGIVDVPCTARDLIPVIDRAVAEVHDSLPDTAEAPALTEDTDTLKIQTAPPSDLPREFTSLDSVLVRMGGLATPDGTETINVDMSDAEYDAMEKVLNDADTGEAPQELEEEADEAVTVFQQLAAEEPPMPTLEEGGTISDLITSVGEANSGEVPEIKLHEESVSTQFDDDLDDDDSDTPAKVILQSTLDKTMPLENAIDDLLGSIEGQFPENVRGVKPLPSWVKDIERYVREPDFLEETLPEITDENNLDLLTTRMVHTDDVASDPGNMETDILRMERPSMPATLPEEKQVSLPPKPAGLPFSKPAAKLEDTPVDHSDFDGVQQPPDVDVEIEKEVSEPIAELLPPYEFDEPELIPDQPEPKKIPPAVPGKKERVAELPPYNFQAPVAQEKQADDKLLLAGAKQSSSLRTPPESDFVEQDGRLTFGIHSEDPRMVQIALQLTQVALELTAEAVLLSKSGEVVAYAGTLPYEDVADLHDTISGDWEAKLGEARVRFITLPVSGQDYMLYSRRTEDDFTLSMIFLGNMPLRVIRRQSNRLVEALQSVPELPDETALATEEEELQALEAQAAAEEEAALESTAQVTAITETSAEGQATSVENQVTPAITLTPYTYLWMIRDVNHPLTEPVALHIVEQLDEQLTQANWHVNTLHVFEDYVYLLADVPGDTLQHTIIQDLKQRSAQIAHDSDSSFAVEDLWADSYLVLTPGRQLHQDEIQHFINFGRMR